MHILCVGINHRTADVALRECLAFSEEAVKAGLARLGCGDFEQDAPSEMVVLSTCNRVEIYAGSASTDFQPLERFLSEARSIAVEDFRPYLYELADEEAVQHLLNVAAGLDSLVLGEPQILGQVTHALELARGQNTAGAILSRLFQIAIHAGKRVRTETEISRNPASISSVAVRLAVEVFPHIESAHVLVLGAGEMAELVVESMRKRGVESIRVINRTLERAHALAERWGGSAGTYEQLDQALREADIVVASTGAPHTLIHPPMVQEAMQARPQNPLLFIDISVPRNVDAEVAQIPGVSVCDIDDLKGHLDQYLAAREQEMPGAQAILDEEKSYFLDYLATIDLVPLIREIRDQADAIRRTELEKTFRRMPNLSGEERKRIEVMTEAMVNKLLHAPITRLRAEAQCPGVVQYALVTRTLFGLLKPNQPAHICNFSSLPCPMDHAGEGARFSSAYDH